MPYLDQKEEMGRWKTDNQCKGGPKGQKGKGKGKSAHFPCLGDAELGPEKGEVSANGVNYTFRDINLANITGARDWERKNWAEECSSITNTGFNG